MTKPAKQAALAEKLAEYIPLPANGLRQILVAMELCGYTITEDTAEQATATAPVSEDRATALAEFPVGGIVNYEACRGYEGKIVRWFERHGMAAKDALATPPAAPSDAGLVEALRIVRVGCGRDYLNNRQREEIMKTHAALDVLERALTAPAKKEGE